MFIAAVAVAAGCAGRPLSQAASAPAAPSGGAGAIDERAEQLARRGEWDQARPIVEAGLAEARQRGDRSAEARLLVRRGKLITDQARHRGGDRSAALADLEAARRLAEASGDRAVLAASLDGLGMFRYVHWYASQDPAELASAEALFRDALALRASAGDSAALSESTFHVGLIFQMRGQARDARDWFQRAGDIADRVDSDTGRSDATRHLGYLAQLDRDWVRADQLLQASLDARERLGPGPGVAAAQVALAELRFARDGAGEPAIALLTRARDGAAASHSIAYTGIASGALGRVERDLGHYAAARRWFEAGIAAMDAMHSDEDVPETYEQLALIELLRDQPAAALTEIDRGIARRSSSRLQALRVLAHVRASGQLAPAVADDPDPVVTARLALAAGQADRALTAALTGDDPDTLLLAAHAAGASGMARAQAAAAAISTAQQLRFAREANASR
jgi:tetratricopeptide (TPR) repeat protein